MGLSLSLLFLPLEVQAAEPCDGDPCVKYTDPNVEHDHKITLQGETFSGGTAMQSVDVKGNSTITDGTFQGQVWTYGDTVIKNGTFQRQVDVKDTGKLTIKNGSFLMGIVVYGKAIIEGGSFRGGFDVNSNSVCAHINGGTFESGVYFNSSTGGSITGGVFKGDVYLGADTTVTGGTFLGRVLDRNDNSYTFSADTYHTINFEYSDGTSGKQLVVGNNSISVNPNGGEWLDEETKEEYIFGRSVDKDLTLIEVAHASEGGGGAETGAEAEQVPEGGHTEKGKKEDQNAIPVHTCEYEWVTVREAGAGVDGEEWYQCKLCGRVESAQIIPAASYQTARLYEAVGKAREDETVTYDLGNFHTIADTLLTTLQKRSDVTLVLTFTYQNRCYETTFPKGADYTELLEDEDFFYGLLGLNGRSGIVTQDVTP